MTDEEKRMSKYIDRAQLQQDSFESAVIQELRTSLKWKLSVILLLLFFCAMKVADLVWDYDRNRDLSTIAGMVHANAAALKEMRITMTQLSTDRTDLSAAVQASADGNMAIKRMLDKQYTELQLVDEHLRQCSGCHSHPSVILHKHQ